MVFSGVQSRAIIAASVAANSYSSYSVIANVNANANANVNVYADADADANTNATTACKGEASMNYGAYAPLLLRRRRSSTSWSIMAPRRSTSSTGSYLALCRSSRSAPRCAVGGVHRRVGSRRCTRWAVVPPQVQLDPRSPHLPSLFPPRRVALPFSGPARPTRQG